jgi:hypothetical protein
VRRKKRELATFLDGAGLSQYEAFLIDCEIESVDDLANLQIASDAMLRSEAIGMGIDDVRTLRRALERLLYGSLHDFFFLLYLVRFMKLLMKYTLSASCHPPIALSYSNTSNRIPVRQRVFNCRVSCRSKRPRSGSRTFFYQRSTMGRYRQQRSQRKYLWCS